MSKCPCCGYCPHCGRKDTAAPNPYPYTQPWINPYPTINPRPYTTFWYYPTSGGTAC